MLKYLKLSFSNISLFSINSFKKREKVEIESKQKKESGISNTTKEPWAMTFGEKTSKKSKIKEERFPPIFFKK